MHSSTKLTPTQGSLKKTEGLVHQNFSDKRNRRSPKYEIGDLVRTADKKKTFSKGDTINWSYELNKNANFFKDTIPSYKTINFRKI